MDRISICFFKPGDLLFRPDSGQMEEDLVEVLLDLLKLDGNDLEALLQARGQSEKDLITKILGQKEDLDLDPLMKTRFGDSAKINKNY